ncbi:MAG: cobyric acid synthase [Clostridium perfringens]|nr:cobyric acid synthase [Clostridium perfringens]
MNNVILLGTASGVGKSTLASGICRYLKKKNLKVAPFKALNISLNSYVTREGDEMGRAQVVQARACGIEPKAIMNPLLLKPCGNNKTQIILNGKVHSNMDSYKYKEMCQFFRREVKKSYEKISKEFDFIVLEGSGSCAEINLKNTDIANTYMAKSVDAPIILVSDIDRGGVFASVLGTIMLLDEDERNLLCGVVINKFRGDKNKFKPAIKQLEDLIGVKVLGVMPYFNLDIEDEDGVSDKIKNKNTKESTLDIAVIRLKHMSNFTDFNSFNRVSGVSIRYVKTIDELKNPDIIILPGTKNTLSDLRELKNKGLFEKIMDLINRDEVILFGICGGYQMLGRDIKDPLGIEGDIKGEEGFNLLGLSTEFNELKTLKHTKGYVVSKHDLMKNSLEKEVVGYEIHNGESKILDFKNIFIEDENKNILGLSNEKGNVYGTYIHGIFDSTEFLNSLVETFKEKFNKDLLITEENKSLSYDEYRQKQYDELLKLIEENLDIKALDKILGLK